MSQLFSTSTLTKEQKLQERYNDLQKMQPNLTRQQSDYAVLFAETVVSNTNLQGLGQMLPREYYAVRDEGEFGDLLSVKLAVAPGMVGGKQGVAKRVFASDMQQKERHEYNVVTHFARALKNETLDRERVEQELTMTTARAFFTTNAEDLVSETMPEKVAKHVVQMVGLDKQVYDFTDLLKAKMYVVG